MKKFILRLLVFFTMLAFLDMAFGYLLQSQRPVDYKLFLESKKEFFNTDRNYDLLLIGDSHIADAIDPRIIERNLHIKAFNLGVYHASPIENYYITKAALDNHKIKPLVIVLGTNPDMFERKLSMERYTPLILPYKWNFAYHMQEGFDIKFFSKTFQEKFLINSLLNNIRGKEYNPTRDITDVYNGHLKFFNQIQDTEWLNFTTTKKSNLNKEQVEYFSKTIELALQYDIAVVLVHPPLWPENLDVIVNTESFIDFRNEIDQIAKKYKLTTYYNYLDNKNFYDTLNFQREDFLNTQHLNYYGSEKFTRGFCDFLISKGILSN